jgi:Na+/proline symporter
MTPQRRRLLAGVGLLVPGAVLIAVTAYIALGYGGTQQCTANTAAATSCSNDPIGATLATFPGGVICLVLGAAVLRGVRWVRWPAVVVGALLGVIVAAAALAVVTSLAQESQVGGAAGAVIAGVVLALLCALPALLLSGDQGAAALPGAPPRRVKPAKSRAR